MGGSGFKGWDGDTFSAELEDGPAAPAEADCTQFLEAVFGLQGLGDAFDFGEADVLVVTTEESHQVEFAAFH